MIIQILTLNKYLKMEDTELMTDKIVRVSDILEQIDELNRMIKLHKGNSNTSMLKQYEYMKDQFLEELI